jgi:dihydroorotase-like cyclic amidohydrolase
MSTIRVNQVQDTSTNVAANISGGVVTFTNPPQGTGKVLQVVEARRTTQFAFTSTSYVDAGVSVTITPNSNSSKILLNFFTSNYITNSKNSCYYIRVCNII